MAETVRRFDSIEQEVVRLRSELAALKAVMTNRLPGSGALADTNGRLLPYAGEGGQLRLAPASGSDDWALDVDALNNLRIVDGSTTKLSLYRGNSGIVELRQPYATMVGVTQALTTSTTTRLQYSATGFAFEVTADDGNDELAILHSGVYAIGCHVPFSTSITGSRRVELNRIRNSVHLNITHDQINPSSTSFGWCNIVAIDILLAGDKLYLNGWQNTGGNWNIEGSSFNRFWCMRIGQAP